jgi:2,3-bisphosphoglycerate-independent phosphoglycerate mutase
VLFFNFRADRMRQMVSAFLFQDFDGFDRGRLPATCVFTMRRYRQDFYNDVLLKDDPVEDTLTEYLSRNGYKVYKSAETEKYAHVTYFFNGGREDPWPGEKRVLIQSPQVATYDLKPEMSVYEVTDQLVQELKQQSFDLFVVNFANGDMVGHTGDFQAAVSAVEAIDRCLEQILGAVHWGEEVNVLITADHGNCEEMKFRDGSTNTQHSMNEVPLVLVSQPRRELKPPADWALCGVAPTVLDLMAIPAPACWTCKSLLAR